MSKNILVAKNYNITDHSKWWDDKSNQAEELKNNYNDMQKILVDTAKEHLKDLDDIVVHTGDADNIRNVFKIHFKEIYDLWQTGCNILYCDLDVVFLKEANIFNQFENFSMFNFTDPSSTTDDHYGLTFEKFFNCGIRYYPENMKQEIWDYGFELLDNWNPDRWDCEQVIYNAMLWKQDLQPQDIYKPNISFQMLHAMPLHQINTQFNQMRISEASIVHLHGSRDSINRLETMKDLIKGDFDDEVILL